MLSNHLFYIVYPLGDCSKPTAMARLKSEQHLNRIENFRKLPTLSKLLSDHRFPLVYVVIKLCLCAVTANDSDNSLQRSASEIKYYYLTKLVEKILKIAVWYDLNDGMV